MTNLAYQSPDDSMRCAEDLLSQVDMIKNLGLATMTMSQLHTVLTIAVAKDTNARVIREQVGLTASTFSKVIGSLKSHRRPGQRGLDLVDTMTVPNSNEKRLYLTSKGRALIGALATTTGQ